MSTLKRKDSMMLRGEGDRLDVTPLGAGNEVGRSCVYMTYKGKTVLVSFQIFVFMEILLLLLFFWFSSCEDDSEENSRRQDANKVLQPFFVCSQLLLLLPNSLELLFFCSLLLLLVEAFDCCNNHMFLWHFLVKKLAM